MDATAAYDVRGVTKRHRGSEHPANDRIDLRVPTGEIVGLLGPNGAGKTTLVRQLVGVLRPDAGTIHCFGHDVSRHPAGRWVSYLAQREPALDEVPVRVAVETTARLRGVPRHRLRRAAGAVIEELGLAGCADTPILRLSGGQQRLAAVATALCGDRPVLVLDEPTAGLDAPARRRVWQALRRRRAEGVTVVLVTHNVIEAEALLDRVAVMDRGRVIAADTPGRLKASVNDQVRLEVVWRADPPSDDPTVAALARQAVIDGNRWTVRLAPQRAHRMIAGLADLPEHVDDFRLSTPSLEDVYLALGASAGDLEHEPVP